MHLSLTDRIVCPTCGPEFGLILLANEVRDRRVLEGILGCANCRGEYPVGNGFADLRPSPRTPLSPPDSREIDDREEALRLAALLGLTEGPGTLLIQGPAARLSSGISDLIAGVEVVGMDPILMAESESEGVSRMWAGPHFPFRSGTFRGVLLSGGTTDRDLTEALRVTAPLTRIVVRDASSETSHRLESLGLKILLEEAGVVVAQVDRYGSLPLVTLRGL